MSMFGGFIDSLRGNKFESTTKQIPDLDIRAFERSLNPRKKGKERGLADQPPSDAKNLDHIEREIVAEIRRHQRLALDRFDENREVYLSRLGNIGSQRTDIETAAAEAPTKFKRYSSESESAIQDATNNLQDHKNSREVFRREHNLNRACYRHLNSGLRWFAIAFSMIAVESGLNAYLFAEKNELGLLGGAFVAFLISVVNVGFSSLCGYFFMNIHRRQFYRKCLGFVALVSWVTFIITFNFGVAHFRDGLVNEALTRDEAAILAIESVTDNILAVTTFDSWLLILIGCLICIGAFMKAYFSDDPYPGYGNVQRNLENARDRYKSEHENTLQSLESKHDESIQNLRDAEEEFRRNMEESVDALFGHQSLNAQIADNLNQCEEVAKQLLQIYRDSNEEYRKTPPPAYFREEYKLDRPNYAPIDPDNRKRATEDVDRISALVSGAIEKIEESYGISIENFLSLRELEEKIEIIEK